MTEGGEREGKGIMTAGSSSVNSNLIRTMSKSHASASRHSTGNIEPVQVATFVYRWPPSMVREALSNFGVVKKIGSVPARRYAVSDKQKMYKRTAFASINGRRESKCICVLFECSISS